MQQLQYNGFQFISYTEEVTQEERKLRDGQMVEEARKVLYEYTTRVKNGEGGVFPSPD